mmetsp:Transcript_10018/g.11964  ORF Transcript_10018/g.11964 Transcript_10018/m.11964 type:complete len:330 (-) Transcript_10018:294-1283(-)|eukprot:jgi/Bigna1/84985/estExt_fgenesh1_pg.C_10533
MQLCAQDKIWDDNKAKTSEIDFPGRKRRRSSPQRTFYNDNREDKFVREKRRRRKLRLSRMGVGNSRMPSELSLEAFNFIPSQPPKILPKSKLISNSPTSTIIHGGLKSDLHTDVKQQDENTCPPSLGMDCLNMKTIGEFEIISKSPLSYTEGLSRRLVHTNRKRKKVTDWTEGKSVNKPIQPKRLRFDETIPQRHSNVSPVHPFPNISSFASSSFQHGTARRSCFLDEDYRGRTNPFSSSSSSSLYDFAPDSLQHHRGAGALRLGKSEVKSTPKLSRTSAVQMQTEDDSSSPTRCTSFSRAASIDNYLRYEVLGMKNMLRSSRGDIGYR